MFNLIFKTTIFLSFFYINSFFIKESYANFVVISYDSFGEKDFDLNAIEKHIKILTKEKYFIIPISNIINLLDNSKNLPDYSVGITISSNNKQVIKDIWPIFSKASLNFTLFIDPLVINTFNNNMSWSDIITLKNNGVDIGIRSSSKNISNDINIYIKNLNIRPMYYIYRQGIWSEKELKILNKHNIEIAFTENSGPISATMDKYKLPRFNISGKFTDTQRLETVLGTLPLEITNILPSGNTINHNPPLYGFTLINEKQIPQCYTNNKDKAEVLLVSNNRIEVRTTKFLGQKARINCVSKDINNRLLWYGSLYWVSK
ncbi:MAG: hypothetical protein CMJ12_01585 [Pelagibacterales bacterium]|nr:hypothetical protein [Pelagibacterales bacterium]PPR16076.1 MAG: hypothetical protein CFH33_01002 [Alphaproteobacteria bacterium MarineAlpha9_Bin3]|tara:strand:+ start:17636 stop:18586 length:951 start_codon:yes stop_codon:yes gene_type:complete